MTEAISKDRFVSAHQHQPSVLRNSDTGSGYVDLTRGIQPKDITHEMRQKALNAKQAVKLETRTKRFQPLANGLVFTGVFLGLLASLAVIGIGATAKIDPHALNIF